METYENLDDDTIIAKIKQTENEDEKKDLVASIKNDDKKISMIDLFEDEWDKMEIAMTIEDDEKKIEVLKKFDEEDIKMIIATTIGDDEKQLGLIDLFEDVDNKVNVAVSIWNIDIRIEALSKIDDEWERTRVIMSLPEDKMISFIDVLKDEENKKDIIAMIEDDDKKLELLHKITDEGYRYEIIQTLKDDDKKIEVLDEISNEEYKSFIVADLNDDNKKMELLDKFGNESDKATIIASLADDITKIELLEKFEEETNKAKVIGYLKDDNTKVELLTKLKDDKNKVEVLKTMRNDFEALKVIEQYGIDVDIDEVISFIRTRAGANRVLKQYSESLTDEKKIALGNSIENDKLRNKFLDEHTPLEENLEELKVKEYNSKALDLPQELTIGVEIEAEGIDERVASKIFNERNIREDIQNDWEVEQDLSLDKGVELVSPILNSSAESMEQIDYVCDFMQLIGTKVKDTCGAHIHFGADYLGNDLRTWENLFNIWEEAEELFYKMSNDVGEVTREKIIQYARKESNNIQSIYNDGSVTLEKDEDFQELIDKMTEDRYYGINLKNLGNPEKNTIEFRIPNGTIDGKVEKENILLFGKLMQTSKELVNDKDLQKKYKVFSNHNLTEAEKVDALLDLLFEKEQDKEIYRNRWDSVKDNSIYNRIKSDYPTFERGSYARKKGLDDCMKGELTEVIQDEEITILKESLNKTSKKEESILGRS